MKSTLDKQTLNALQKNLNMYMQSDPLFMLFCPRKEKRADFADKYFNYYLEKWAKKNELLISESKKTAVTLIDPKDFKYNFSGKNALPLKFTGNSQSVFIHRESVEAIVNIVVPVQMNKKIVTVYGNPAENLDEITALIKECIKTAEQEGFVLVYETLSRKLVPVFESLGFEIGYAKQFMNTQFFQTIMTYNV